MGQLEDFRASLKRKDSAVRSEGCPIGSGMTERRADIPSGSFLLFISLLNGGTGGDSLFLVLFPAVRAQ